MIVQALAAIVETGRSDVTYLISDLYSVGPSGNIKWFLYVFDVSEVEEGTVEGRHGRANICRSVKNWAFLRRS
jgi:hypothetical protein